MFSAPLQDERPSRKTKSENRLYNFLTRSRSRSQSKDDSTPFVDSPPVPDMPQNVSASKPSTRLQSRPLSSTTTATNTTITPHTPRPKKRAPSAIPIPSHTSDVHENDHSSKASTSKSSATRKRLHNLFGIPLSSSRKTSLGSKPNSPRPSSSSLEAPAFEQPHAPSGNDHDSTPKPRKSYSPHPNSQSHSPLPASDATPRPKLTTNTSSTNTNATTSSASTTTSSKIDHFLWSQKLFSGTSLHASHNVHSTNTNLPSSSPPPSYDSATTYRPTAQNDPSVSSSPTHVSAPLKHSALHHRRSNSAKASSLNPSPTTPTKPTVSTVPESRTVGQMLPPPPKIIHTPATPLTTPQRTTAPAVKLDARNNSLDSGYRSRAGTVVAGEEKKAGVTTKGKEKEGSSRLGLPMRSNTVHRSTKHGSFDFERPGWGGAAMKRSGSGGTVDTVSGYSKSGESVGLSMLRESAGPGLAGVGTLQRDVSFKRSTEDQAKAKLKAEERKKRHQKPTQTPEEVQKERTGASTSTTGTGKKSSSWGKSTGRGLFKNGGGRLGLSHHGPFSFEPPVPSPTWSTGSGGQNVSWSASTKEKEQVKDEKEKERVREKKTYKGDRAPVPVPVPMPGLSGHRSGSKGRSLDLGLGLAWAPTTVREDALLPSSTFFARSFSGASSLGGQSVGSLGASYGGRSNGGSFSSKLERAGSGSKRVGFEPVAEDRDRSKVGREVAEVFRNALDDNGYIAFKKYVHQFDAHDIQFDGPTGIVARVEKLLESAPGLGDEGKRHLLDNFVRIILQNA